MGASNLFPTPIFLHDVLGFSDKNEVLNGLAQKLRAEDPEGVTKSNRDGGWHSADSLDLRDLPEMVDLKKVILDATKQVIDGMGFDGLGLLLTSAWFIISPAGASNIKHDHPRSFLSGVYYVKAPPGSSPIVFHDPRPVKMWATPISEKFKATPYTSPTVSFEAKESRLLIFPGWLEHSVPKNTADGERVALSFNLVVV